MNPPLLLLLITVTGFSLLKYSLTITQIPYSYTNYQTLLINPQFWYNNNPYEGHRSQVREATTT